MPAPVSTPCMRKTRIVCVSDTHNQTPKLPCGDVLIHAGDLTNQGSYSELKKAVEWIERQDFEAKIVVAGNHEITLDAPFFNKNKGSWKWPGDQDPTACKKLLVESKSITYLEHTTTTVELTSPNGPGTRFTVFGSPYTPQQANWAFQYRAEEAEDVWNKIPDGVDIVVTHTPPKGHCDGSAEASRDGREGCPALLRRLSKIRPKLSICGHIHQGRGVETVRWRTQPLDQATQSDSGSLVQSVEFWSDPGQTSNKISLVDLTIKSIAGRDLGCDTGLPRQSMSDSMQDGTMRSQADASLAPDVTWRQPPSGDGNLVPTSSLTGIALENNEAWWRGENHSKQLRNAGHACLNDGCRTGRAFGGAETARIETTTVVNAAYLGPRIAGKPTGHHKPIVVDVQVPVWKCPDEE